MLAIDLYLHMRKITFFFTGLLLLCSCYSTHEPPPEAPPDNLIDKDKVVLIMADVEIAEAALRQKENQGHEIAETSEAYYYAIFASYEVSKEQFDSSMAYYRRDMEALNEIYEEVITRLSVIESEIQHE